MTISIMNSRNRTPSQIIGYELYLYFLGLSFRNTAKALSFLQKIKISHVSTGTGFKSTNQRNTSRIRKSKSILIYKR